MAERVFCPHGVSYQDEGTLKCGQGCSYDVHPSVEDGSSAQPIFDDPVPFPRMKKIPTRFERLKTLFGWNHEQN